MNAGKAGFYIEDTFKMLKQSFGGVSQTFLTKPGHVYLVNFDMQQKRLSSTGTWVRLD